MKWIMIRGFAHLIVKAEDNVVETACGTVWVDPEIGGVADVEDFQGRPFGPDTDHMCHSVVKGWHTHPESAPEGLMDAKPIGPFVPTVKARADRDAAIQGLATKTDPAAEGAQVPVAAVAGRRSTTESPGDDLVFPDDGVPTAAIVDGATFIAPEPGPRRKSRRPAADIEIDSDGMGS